MKSAEISKVYLCDICEKEIGKEFHQIMEDMKYQRPICLGCCIAARLGFLPKEFKLQNKKNKHEVE